MRLPSVRLPSVGLPPAVILLALLTAGCVEEPAVGDPTYTLPGTFAESASQSQMEELGQYVEARGGDLLLMESFPVQFRATGLDARGCGEVRTFATSKAYVADIGACAGP